MDQRKRADGAPPPPIVIPPSKRQPGRPHKRRRALLVLLLVVLLGVAAGYAGWWFASGRYAHVPDLVGSTQPAAINKLEAAGYKYKLIEPGSSSYSNTIHEGLVLRTDPDAHTRLVRGHTVTVYISAGPRYYTLPPVRGQSQDAAFRTLRGVGPLTIVSAVKPEPSMTVPRGQAIRTVPAAGAKVRSDQAITVYMSTGPPIIDIPKISANTPFDEAKHALKQAGFKVSTVLEWSDSIDKDSVITIRPSDKAAKGSTIDVTVSKGPQFVQIPNFSQLEPIGDVRHALETLGLHVNVHKAFGGHSGFVVGIDPPSGTTVQVGTTVTVTIV